MKREEFYKDAYPGLKLAERRLLDLLDFYKAQAEEDSDLQPIIYTCSRIKKPDRMLEKLEHRESRMAPRRKRKSKSSC